MDDQRVCQVKEKALDYHIQPDFLKNTLKATLRPPASKSHTMRAILFAFLAQGKSFINNYLPSPDTDAMIQAIKHFGAKVEVFATKLQIEGVGFKPCPAENVVDAGNSGQVLRFIAAIGALIPSYTIITGDDSIRHRRPIQTLLSAFKNLGAFAESSRGDGFAPIIIKGPIHGGHVTIDGTDSQPVSGLIIASCFAKGQVDITVENPSETPWIDVTLHWLKRLNIPYKRCGYHHYTLFGNSFYKNFNYTVPSDFSSLAFPIAFAVLTNSEAIFTEVDTQDVQGDKAFLDILISMGASIEVKKEQRMIQVKKGSQLRGAAIDLNACIDALPILAVIGCFSEGTTHLFNAQAARHKECDRIASITKELKKMGADIQEKEDGLVVKKSFLGLKGSTLSTYCDHRMGMALSVAGLLAQGDSVIKNTECINKSYPNFKKHLKQLGATIV